jgi:hypothetical protein
VILEMLFLHESYPRHLPFHDTSSSTALLGKLTVVKLAKKFPVLDGKKVKVKLSLYQAVKAHRVVRR